MNNIWIIPLVLMVGIAIGFLFGAFHGAAAGRRSVDEDLEREFAFADQQRLDFIEANDCDLLFDPLTQWIVIPALTGAEDQPRAHTGDTLRAAIDSAREEVTA